MRTSALEVNTLNPAVKSRVEKISKLKTLNDGSKISAREINDDEVVAPGRLSEYDLRVFQRDEPRIVYAVFSFETPIAWVIEDDNGDDLRFITNLPITPTTERHRDVVRLAWR